MDLLRWDTEEDGEEKSGSEDSREDDVDQIEGIPPFQMDREDDVGESLVPTALEVELAPF